MSTRWVLLLLSLLLISLTSLNAEQLCGDVNNDGVVLTVSDIVELQRYLAGQIDLAEPTNADVDLCDNINAADLSLYLAYFVWGMPWQICVPADQCVQPTGVNSVRIGCRTVYDPYYTDSVGVPIYITTDQQMLGMSLGFHWNSDQINVTSVDTVGTCLPSSHQLYLFSVQDEDYKYSTPDTNQIMLLVHQNPSQPGEFIEPQSDGYLATLWFNVVPDPVSESVDLDSAFFPPGGEFVFVPAAGGVISPAYVDCGTSNIVISTLCGDDIYTNCHPGDFNGNGLINIEDVMCYINYVFNDGFPPRPYDKCSGDANADGMSGITDAVDLISWIFTSGYRPFTCEEWSTSGCGSGPSANHPPGTGDGCTDPGNYNPGPWVK